jgi:Rrf2 family protein
MFSKACEYGIRALIFITLKSTQGERVNLADISEEIASPPAFTAKILQKLVKATVIDSVKGPHGGFHISEKNKIHIVLADIVHIIDGDTFYKGCALGLKKCTIQNPCPLHFKFNAVRADFNKMLQETSLKDLSYQLENGTAVLKL